MMYRFYHLKINRYKKKVLEACNNPKTHCSIIMDGMDQNNCSIPYCGTQQKFSNPLTQAILGVKQHDLVSNY